MKRGLLVLLLLTLTACNDPYGVAAKLAQDVAVADNQAAVSVDQLRTQGTITPTEERAVLGYLTSINTLDGQYIGCVQVAHGSTVVGGFTKCVQALLVGIGDPTTLAALHVSNPASQAKLVAIVQAIDSLVNATSVALGGK
jgi:hypothetical protein